MWLVHGTIRHRSRRISALGQPRPRPLMLRVLECPLHAESDKIAGACLLRGIGYFMAGALALSSAYSAGTAAPSLWKVGRTWGAAITTAPYATSAAAVV